MNPPLDTSLTLEQTLATLERAKSAAHDATSFRIAGRFLAASIAFDRAAREWGALGCDSCAAYLRSSANECRDVSQREQEAAETTQRQA